MRAAGPRRRKATSGAHPRQSSTSSAAADFTKRSLRKDASCCVAFVVVQTGKKTDPAGIAGSVQSLLIAEPRAQFSTFPTWTMRSSCTPCARVPRSTLNAYRFSNVGSPRWRDRTGAYRSHPDRQIPRVAFRSWAHAAGLRDPARTSSSLTLTHLHGGTSQCSA